MTIMKLGNKIQKALRQIGKKSNVDSAALTEMLKDISRALLEADVNVKLVMQMQKNIKASINLDDMGGGLNKNRIIQKAVYDELVTLCDPGKEGYKPKKGQPNVIMFVGLQVSIMC